MAEPKARPSSTTDYSASQAPDTQDAAHHTREHDHRAIPGGDPARATAALGMESLDLPRASTPPRDTRRA
jgi:hypothetical protein